MIDIWKILVAVLSVFGGKREPVDEYPYVIPDEIPSGEPYVPQSSREIEEAANALYGHGDDIIYNEGDGPSYAGIKGNQYRWPDNTIPISVTKEVSEDEHLLQNIERVRRYIERKTCLKIVSKKPKHRNYVLITKANACSSNVGCMRKGKQLLSLGKGCDYFGTILHEMSHAVGLYHEHNRSDRDRYLYVYKDNVKAGEWYNFQKTKAGKEVKFGVKYDYFSVMHYGNHAFAKRKGLVTLEAKDGTPLRNAWQKTKFTPGDITTIRKLYKC